MTTDKKDDARFLIYVGACTCGAFLFMTGIWSFLQLACVAVHGPDACGM